MIVKPERDFNFIKHLETMISIIKPPINSLTNITL